MSLYLDVKYIMLISFRLRNFKQKSKGLFNFSCPFCGDSVKNTLRARAYAYVKGDKLCFKCHNCGVSHPSIFSLLEFVDPVTYKEYVFENFKGSNKSPDIKKSNVPIFKFGQFKDREFDSTIRCAFLKKDHPCIEYLMDRKIPQQFFSKLMYTKNFRDFIEEVYPKCLEDKKIYDDERLIIPVYNNYNKLIAVIGRSIEDAPDHKRYIFVGMDESSKKIVFGLDRLNFDKEIRVVEGAFDSLFVENCIAATSSALHSAALMLHEDYKIPKDKFILIFDNENRNKEIIKLIKKSIGLGFNVVIWPETIKYKDINDMIKKGNMTQNDIEDIIKNNTYSGLQANIKLSFWKKV